MTQKEKKVFFCYNPRLRKWLDQNGTSWIDKGIHSVTNKPYWVFEQSTRLSNLIKEYKGTTK